MALYIEPRLKLGHGQNTVELAKICTTRVPPESKVNEKIISLIGQPGLHRKTLALKSNKQTQKSQGRIRLLTRHFGRKRDMRHGVITAYCPGEASQMGCAPKRHSQRLGYLQNNLTLRPH